MEAFCTFFPENWLSSSCIFHGFQMQVSWPVASSAWSTWRPEGFQHGTLGDSFVLVREGGVCKGWIGSLDLAIPTHTKRPVSATIHPSTIMSWDCSNFWYWIISRFDLSTAGCISNLWCNISTSVADMGLVLQVQQKQTCEGLEIACARDNWFVVVRLVLTPRKSWLEAEDVQVRYLFSRFCFQLPDSSAEWFMTACKWTALNGSFTVLLGGWILQETHHGSGTDGWCWYEVIVFPCNYHAAQMIPWHSIVLSGTCTSWSSFASYTLGNMPSRWCSSRPQFAQARFGIWQTALFWTSFQVHVTCSYSIQGLIRDSRGACKHSKPTLFPSHLGMRMAGERTPGHSSGFGRWKRGTWAASRGNEPILLPRALSISGVNGIISWCTCLFLDIFRFMHTRVNGVYGLPLPQTSRYSILMKVLGLLINKIGLDLRSFVEPRHKRDDSWLLDRKKTAKSDVSRERDATQLRCKSVNSLNLWEFWDLDSHNWPVCLSWICCPYDLRQQPPATLPDRVGGQEDAGAFSILFPCHSPTAITFGSLAIVKVSGKNCFRTLYGSVGQLRLGPPKGSVESFTKVAAVFHQGSTNVTKVLSSFAVSLVLICLGCQKVLWKVPPSLL